MTTWDGISNRWTGDEWRWGLQAPSSAPTIAVIEPAKDPIPSDSRAAQRAEAEVKKARLVPFGFARALKGATPYGVAPDEP